MTRQTTLPARQITETATQQWRLVIYPGDGEARQLWLERGGLDIGRDGSNGLQLNDGRVSGYHLRLRHRKDTKALEATDQNTTNGTFHNGQGMTQGVLANNDVLRLGDTLIVCEYGYRPSLDGPTVAQSLQNVLEQDKLLQAAQHQAPVLLLGETGVGKGHFAARLHQATGNAKPFVAVNCAAIPEALFESELFGHARGAFSGAVNNKPGLIKAADGGMLFLDEIGAMAAPLQAKLLSCLETGTVRPVGSTRDEPVDVRFVAATNEDIDEAIERGHFRDDLYHRLAGQVVSISPLRRRRADIVRILMDIEAITAHLDLTPEALEALLVHPWPGNVRELLNVSNGLKHVDGRRDYHRLPDHLVAFLRKRVAGGQRAETPSRDVLEAALANAGNNVSEVARQLGKHRNQVVRWMKGYGLG